MQELINKMNFKIENKLNKLIKKTHEEEIKELLKKEVDEFKEKINTLNDEDDIYDLYSECVDNLYEIISQEVNNKYIKKIEKELNEYLKEVADDDIISQMMALAKEYKEEIKNCDSQEKVKSMYDDYIVELEGLYEESQEIFQSDELDQEISEEIEKYINKINKKKEKYLNKTEKKEKVEEIINEFVNKLEVENFDEDYEEDIADLYDDCLDELDDLVIDEEDDFSESLNNFNKAFSYKNMNKDNKKYIGLLPFMSKDDIEECFDEALKNDDNSIIGFLPFLQTDKVDELFEKIVNKEVSVKLSSVLPFVSSNKLSWFVSEYVSGRYQDVNINNLYPFLKSEDIKKLYFYMINK